MQAAGAYAAGDQVFVSYGERDNLRLLLHYGFALSDNPEGRVAFDVIDLAEGSMAALPHVFGPVKEKLLTRLLEEVHPRHNLRPISADLAACSRSVPHVARFRSARRRMRRGGGTSPS